MHKGQYHALKRLGQYKVRTADYTDLENAACDQLFLGLISGVLSLFTGANRYEFAKCEFDMTTV